MVFSLPLRVFFAGVSPAKTHCRRGPTPPLISAYAWQACITPRRGRQLFPVIFPAHTLMREANCCDDSAYAARCQIQGYTSGRNLVCELRRSLTVV